MGGEFRRGVIREGDYQAEYLEQLEKSHYWIFRRVMWVFFFPKGKRIFSEKMGKSGTCIAYFWWLSETLANVLIINCSLRSDSGFYLFLYYYLLLFIYIYTQPCTWWIDNKCVLYKWTHVNIPQASCLDGSTIFINCMPSIVVGTLYIILHLHFTEEETKSWRG